MQPGQRIVAIDPRYFRPTEVDSLVGDASKARNKLGWQPRTSFQQMVAEMVQRDLHLAKRDVLLADGEFRAPSFYDALRE